MDSSFSDEDELAIFRFFFFLADDLVVLPGLLFLLALSRRVLSLVVPSSFDGVAVTQ